jgi:hypothetical protein
LVLHEVHLIAGWEKDGSITETVLETNLVNEDETTLVRQKRRRWDDPKRQQAPYKDHTMQCLIRFYCYDCKSWDNTFRIQEEFVNNPNHKTDGWKKKRVHTSTWEPASKE